jgi:hypothetical protein
MTGQAILQPGWLQAVSLHGTVSAQRVAAGVRIQLPHPGRPAPYPTLLIAVFDDSGSVAGPVGSDPLSGRYEEARRAFEVVARRGATHELGAVLHFDSPCSGDISPTPLVRRSLFALRGALRVPHDGAGSSELGPSLRWAYQLAAEHPDHQATLVLFSDFLLLDPEPGPVLRDLAAFPGDVHAVVLGGRLPTGVLGERIQRTDITQEDQPGALALALFGSLTSHRLGHPHAQVAGNAVSISQRTQAVRRGRLVRGPLRRRSPEQPSESSGE